MEKTITRIPFNYVTIKITNSRISKGLLAIPVSLIKLFPKQADQVYLVDENDHEEINSFTPYVSSSRECRIGGMRDFYERYHVQSGDELVVQVLSKNRFKILPEKLFEKKIVEFESKIDKASDDKEVNAAITGLAEFTTKNPDEILKNEFIRLSNQNITARKIITRPNVKLRETVPPAIRKILLGLYEGRCQISGFSFVMTTGEPYFEVHHINPLKGNHVKNLLVVSPNVHAQFTYAKLQQFFDAEGWLRKVEFNGETHHVFQMIDKLPSVYNKEVHYV